MLIRNGLTSHSLLLRDLLSNQTNSSVVSDNLARKCTVYTPEDWRQLFPVIGGKMFRLTPAIKNLSSVPSCVRNFTTWKFSTTPVSKYYPRIVATKPPMAPKVQKPAPQPIVTVKKANLPQSPWKMNFLVKLIRGTWVPDAQAQLKFSPKHRAVDVAKMVSRATAVARIFHEAIPEELLIKEVFVTKGVANKRMRIMGRGRAGVGYVRRTHVTVKVEIINFANMIENAKTHSQKAKWAKIQQIAINKRLEGVTGGPTMQTKASVV